MVDPHPPAAASPAPVAASALGGGPFRVGEVRVDPATDEVFIDGLPTKLEPRCMNLLVCLAEQAGQVMSVERLLDEVWKDVVVNPDSVYQTVATLRRVLKDDAREPRYIANVVRRGYRLIAPVIREGSVAVSLGVAASAAPAPAPVPAPARDIAPQAATPERRVRRIAPLLALSALVALSAVYFGSLLVAGYRTRHAQTGAAAVEASIPYKSVAVLPFLDLSEKHDEGYFADGISEELIDVIAREPNIRVPARTSSFYFRDRPATVAEIARSLRVTHLLEGSVRRSGETLRITVQLIRTDTGFHVWSKTYDRPVTDIFKVQDEIAAAVVESLESSLLHARSTNAPPSVNPAAYTKYLKAWHLIASGASTEEYTGATDLVRQALVIDPKFALGWAGLADFSTADLGWHADIDTAALCERARQADQEALRLDASLAQAHRALGNIYIHCDDASDKAEAEYRRAIALDPDDMASYRTLSQLYTSTNRPRHALELASRAAAADPLNPWAFIDMAFAQGLLGQLDAAERSYRKAVELQPTMEGLHSLLAHGLLSEGKVQEAYEEYQREGDEEFRMMNAPIMLDAVGRHEEAQKAFEAYSARYPDQYYDSAVFYACRGDADRAIGYLQRMRKGSLLWDVPDRLACLKKLDRDPRFQALWKAQNLPPPDY